MNSRLVVCIAVLSAGGLPAFPQTVISSGHVDVGVLYEGGAWDLHVHKESPPEAEYAPGDAVIQVGVKAQLAGGVPNTPASVGFFGTAGSPLWILPKSQDSELPFLGVGAEEMSASDWNGALTLSLNEVNGPGHLFVWDVGAFGELQPKMNSRDGVTSADFLSVEAGSHAHHFWAFSAPGDYEVVVSARGNHTVDGLVDSGPVGYRFQVVPEPHVGWLLAAGGLCLAVRRNRVGSC